ncbi:hypothetical protein P8452_42552 [Trifolium repens]|nr:hypothetical protein P8452_42552 [Trifolium repens]
MKCKNTLESMKLMFTTLEKEGSRAIPRETCDMGECMSSDGQDFDISTNLDVSKDDCEVDLVREDVPDEIFEIPLSELLKQGKNESDDDTSVESDDECTDNSSTC